MMAAPQKPREKSPTKIELEEDRDEIHDHLVLSHRKPS
jgi:hypothetical protein